MAVLINQITVGDIIIATIDVNPITSGGLSLPAGSIASALDNSGIFYKNGPLVTDWAASSAGGSFTTGSIAFAGPSGLTQDNANFFWDNTNKRLGIGTNVPTSFLDLPAAIAASASLRLRTGVAPTVPNLGDFWINTANLFFYDGARTNQIGKCLTGSASLNFPSTPANSSSELTITVTGAVPGDVVAIGLPPGAFPPNCSYTAYVSVGNTVTVRFNNYSTAPVDPSTGTFKVLVFKN
jgi:hypothetical protein